MTDDSDKPDASHPPSDDRHRGSAHSSPYGLSRLAPSIRLVEVAKEIEKADEMLSAVTEAKLRIIADQIRLLQDEARKALSQAKESFELHQARCSFSRRVGVTYHLYESTEKYWSMLSPEEWNGTPPHRFLGSYRLLADQSWERVPNQST